MPAGSEELAGDKSQSETEKYFWMDDINTY